MAFSFGGGNSNYPYAVARVQAKRAKLIPPSEYAKILKMDVPEITRTIEESAYKAEVDELAHKFSGLDLLEAALTVNEERTFQSVRRMLRGPGGQLVNLYLRRFIAEDLKTVLRGKMAGASREELLREMLLEDLVAYELFAPVLAEDVRTLDDVIAALERQGGEAREWARVLQKVPQGSPLPRYEDAIDKHTFSTLLAFLEGSDQKGAAEFLQMVRREVDAVNLLNSARWVASGVDGDFTAYIVPGGKHLKIAQLVALSRSKDLAAFQEALSDSPLYADVREGLDQARTTGRLAVFQQAVWRSLLADLDRLGHMHPLSVVPILLFIARKHREVVTLRAIARGKAAGLGEHRLAELIL